MVSVTEDVFVEQPPAVVVKWLQRMPSNFRDWHPKEHRWFRTRDGEEELREGSVATLLEWFGRLPILLTFVVVSVREDGRFEWRALFPLSLLNVSGVFRLTADGNGTHVEATTNMGWTFPVLGRLLDWLVGLMLPARAIRAHMREEGVCMKALLERR